MTTAMTTSTGIGREPEARLEMPDERERRLALVDNPAQLYGFTPTA